MEISGKGLKPINMEAYVGRMRDAKSAEPAKQQTQAVGEKDKVQLSDRAKEAQKARQTLKSMPDVREDKVKEIKTQVDSGTYQVQGNKVAFRMLGDAFQNNAVMHQFQTVA